MIWVNAKTGKRPVHQAAKTMAEAEAVRDRWIAEGYRDVEIEVVGAHRT